ncbi:MAG: FMN-binding protein [bacterium]
MKKALFTFLFMVIITTFFIGALGFIHAVSREKIIQNQKIKEIKSVLYAGEILPEGIDEVEISPAATTADLPWNEERVQQIYRSSLETLTLPLQSEYRKLLKQSFLSFKDSVAVYVLQKNNGTLRGYGFPLRGKGLWGTITAFAVVSPDLTHMIGIDFTEQSETPGLGARITESEFKYYFRGLKLTGFFNSTDQTPVRMVSHKDESNKENPTSSFQAITGATQTCNGVRTMLNTDLRFYLRILKDHLHSVQESSLNMGDEYGQ